jgi:hypothetical protein
LHVVLKAFPTLTEAQIARGALRAAGFEAEVLDEHVGRVLAVDLIGGFRLVVPEGEERRARTLLDEIANPPSEPGAE